MLGDRIDEWLVGQLKEYEGKRLQDVTRGDLELGTLFGDADRKIREADLKESKSLLRRVKDALGERVSEVRVSTRLTDSPSCLVIGEHDLSRSMRRILESAGQPAPATRPVLELNVQHPLVKYLDGLTDASGSRSSRCCCSTSLRSLTAPSSRILPTTCGGSIACCCHSASAARLRHEPSDGRTGLLT